MQQTRKTSFLKTLFGGAKRQIEQKKPVQPLDERHLGRIAGGLDASPKGGWQ